MFCTLRREHSDNITCSRKSNGFKHNVFVTPATFMLAKFNNIILPVREPSWSECLFHASNGMQMLILVSSYATKAECKIFIFLVVKPWPSVELLRLVWCLSKLTLGEAEGSWLVWLLPTVGIGSWSDITLTWRNRYVFKVQKSTKMVKMWGGLGRPSRPISDDPAS